MGTGRQDSPSPRICLSRNRIFAADKGCNRVARSLSTWKPLRFSQNDTEFKIALFLCPSAFFSGPEPFLYFDRDTINRCIPFKSPTEFYWPLPRVLVSQNAIYKVLCSGTATPRVPPTLHFHPWNELVPCKSP